MDTCNPDLDDNIVRWGLHHLCSLPHHGSNSVTHYESVSCPIEHFVEEHPKIQDLGNINVESDEVIAHALQEEFSLLASVETSGSLDVQEEHLQASISSQDWVAPTEEHCNIGHQSGVEDVDCQSWIPRSSSGELSTTEKDCSYSLEIDEESTLDNEVGKRLDNIVHVPHVPKINGELPTMDEAISDHQRLLDRLQLYDLVESKVQGDGNCQFRALSDQIYRSPDYHKAVRQRILDQLRSCREAYCGYVPMEYDEYLEKISVSGEWGDHVTLKAAADSYGLKIFVLTSFKDTCVTEILPQIIKSTRVIYLSFWAEVHYNSLYSLEDLPLYEKSKKKKWWGF